MNVSRGRYFENKAANFLIKAGHVILTKNFYTPFGEIDIISVFENKVYFTEVKFLTKSNKLNPVQKIDLSKIRRIYLSISYLKRFCKIKNYQVDSLSLYYRNHRITLQAELVFEHYQDLRLA
jgi:putative endonuclease